MTGRALLSLHVVDIAHGIAAEGLRVDLFRRPALELDLLTSRRTDGDGKVAFEQDVISIRDLPCRFTLNMYLGDYFGDRTSARFLTVMPFNFVLADASCHYHLPAKITPFGLSLFVTRSAPQTLGVI